MANATYFFGLFLCLCSWPSLLLAFEVKDETYQQVHSFPATDEYVVNYIRTGQGTCQILQCGGSGGQKEAVVLDCGGATAASLPDAVLEPFLKALLPDRTNVTLSISHPDEDHFNYLDKLPPNAYYNSTVFVGGPENGKKNSKSIKDIYIDALETIFHPPRQSPKLVFSNELLQKKDSNGRDYNVNTFPCGQRQLAILYGNTDATSNANAWSLAIYADLGANGALFQGDLVKKEQDTAFNALQGRNIKGTPYPGLGGAKSDINIHNSVYSAAHHGSKLNDSYFEDWYDKFSPISVAMTVGLNRNYKHPQLETITKYIDKLPQDAVSTHNVTYYGAPQTTTNPDVQKIKNALTQIMNEYNKRDAMEAAPAPMDTSPPSGPALLPPPALPAIPLPDAAPTLGFNRVHFIKPGPVDRDRMLGKITTIRPLLMEIINAGQGVGWKAAEEQARKAAGLGERYTELYSTSPTDINGHTMKNYQAVLFGLLPIISKGFSDERQWSQQTTEAAFYETLSNGSLSYFYSGGALNSLTCYHEINRPLEACLGAPSASPMETN